MIPPPLSIKVFCIQLFWTVLLLSPTGVLARSRGLHTKPSRCPARLGRPPRPTITKTFTVAAALLHQSPSTKTKTATVTITDKVSSTAHKTALVSKFRTKTKTKTKGVHTKPPSRPSSHGHSTATTTSRTHAVPSVHPPPSPSHSPSAVSSSKSIARPPPGTIAPPANSPSTPSLQPPSVPPPSSVQSSHSLVTTSVVPPSSPAPGGLQTCEISVYTYAPASECARIYDTAGACGLSTYFPDVLSSTLPRLAVPMGIFDQYGSSQYNTLCGKTVTIKGLNGYVGKAIIADRNEGTSFDLCMDLWTSFGYTSGGGRFAASYTFD
ncbi:hypothetical protein P389DRAFT_60485 [Cystobasidium minutum MCA 4210]|uniref:uncharacterized protein n=1 Tax=Cystobasidium minutum MCA 4210 TaxID=1397322 RepID=UPI0034CEF0ED|eukprot:jgi/Rhomi1/60485/CE60484_95